MLAPSLRPLRPLIVAAALAAATATTAAAPASAATGGHGTKAAKAAKAKAKAKKVKKVKKPAGKADLVARNLRLDFLSDGLAVDANIVNIGKGRANKSDVSIVLSADESFDEGDDVLEELPLGGLVAGVTRHVQTEVAIPEVLPDGDLYLLVCADGNGVVNELKESNNCVSQLVASDSVDEEDDASDDDDGEGSDQAAIDDADDGETV